ncbi:unnamed protein product [Polarella glacialis]|uniref:Uncharacterized protein n=1 Tax=Polarella glacialis TaxID=89957 RepID=A0A813H7R7_POLGL|nr:unnamed protein product [Polarella glacialis]
MAAATKSSGKYESMTHITLVKYLKLRDQQVETLKEQLKQAKANEDSLQKQVASLENMIEGEWENEAEDAQLPDTGSSSGRQQKQGTAMLDAVPIAGSQDLEGFSVSEKVRFHNALTPSGPVSTVSRMLTPGDPKAASGCQLKLNGATALALNRVDEGMTVEENLGCSNILADGIVDVPLSLPMPKKAQALSTMERMKNEVLTKGDRQLAEKADTSAWKSFAKGVAESAAALGSSDGQKPVAWLLVPEKAKGRKIAPTGIPRGGPHQTVPPGVMPDESMSIRLDPPQAKKLGLGSDDTSGKKAFFENISRCKLDYSSIGHLKITGHPMSCEFFNVLHRVYLSRKMTVEDAAFALSVEVPREAIGAAFGAGAHQLNRWQDEEGVLIVNVEDSKSVGRPTLIILSLEPRARLTVESRIMFSSSGKDESFFRSKLSNNISSNSGVARDVYYIHDGDEVVCYVTGQKGLTRKKLEKASGCSIEIVGHFALLVGR